MKDASTEFRFLTLRWDDEMRKNSDTYIVYLKLRGRDSVHDVETNEELIRRYGKTIVEGLIYYSTFMGLEGEEPVKHVIFNTSEPGRPHHYIGVDEL